MFLFAGQYFDGRCYTFVNERLTWNAAEYKCASLSSMKSTMTTVRSKEHFNFLIKLASKKSFWIGKFSMRSITCILLSACDTGTSSLPPDDQCLYHKVIDCDTGPSPTDGQYTYIIK